MSNDNPAAPDVKPQDTVTAEMIEQANRAAVFHPYVHADDNNGATGLPCIEIAGVQVYVYLDRSPVTGRARVRVSPHFDTADPEVFGPSDIVDYEHSVTR